MSRDGRRGDVAPIERIDVAAYRVPTEAPESDGTCRWTQTTAIVVHAEAAGRRGLGYSYGSAAAAVVIRDHLAPVVQGRDALAVPACWRSMVAEVRNIGRPGIASMAIAAVDNALWDLKARVFDVPLVQLLGAVRSGTPVYGSGGFTSYTVEQLQHQLSAWVDAGIRRVKMKVGRNPSDDVDRVRAARDAVGADVQLFVDANGAYDRKQALWFAAHFAELDVSWFEEPVPSQDVDGLRLMRERAPPGMEITAGEYGSELADFQRLLDAGAVDVLMPDATRCQGISGFMKAGALCEAYGIPLSAHTAPSLHVHACCALPAARHLEYFHDHVRVERLLFDGAQEPSDGVMYPDLSRAGLGLELKQSDARKYAL